MSLEKDLLFITSFTLTLLCIPPKFFLLGTVGAKETFVLVLEGAVCLFPDQKPFPRRLVKALLPGIPQDEGTPKKTTLQRQMAKFPLFMLMNIYGN